MNFMDIVARVPRSLKVKKALSLLDLAPNEREIVDDMIATLCGNVFVSTILGSEVTTLEGAILWYLDREPSAVDKHAAPLVDALRRQPVLLDMVAQSTVTAMSKSPHRSVFASILTKVSDLIPPAEGEHWENEYEFVRNGLLPILIPAGNSNDDESSGSGVYVECPYCKESYIHQIS